MIVRNSPGKIYKALVVDISFKNQKNNKRINQYDINNLIIQIIVPDMNLEIEWKKGRAKSINN